MGEKRENCLTMELLLREPQGNANLAVLTRKECIESEQGIIISTLHVGAVDFESLPSNARPGVIGSLHIPVSLIGPIYWGHDRVFVPLALLEPIKTDKVIQCINREARREPAIEVRGDNGTLHIVLPGPCRQAEIFQRLYIMMTISLGFKPILPVPGETGSSKCGLTVRYPGHPWYFNPTIWDIHRIICGEPEEGCIKKRWTKLVAALGLLSSCELLD